VQIRGVFVQRLTKRNTINSTNIIIYSFPYT